VHQFGLFTKIVRLYFLSIHLVLLCPSEQLYRLKLSGRTMALRSTQLLKKWVPRLFPGDKGGRQVRLTTLAPSSTTK